jgi:hypothetical protein
MFDDVINSTTFVDALKQFARIAVDCAFILLAQYRPENSYYEQMMNQALKHLRHALDMKE